MIYQKLKRGATLYQRYGSKTGEGNGHYSGRMKRRKSKRYKRHTCKIKGPPKHPTSDRHDRLLTPHKSIRRWKKDNNIDTSIGELMELRDLSTTEIMNLRGLNMKTQA